MTRRLLEIETTAELDAHLFRSRRLQGCFVQSLDLRDRSDVLRAVDPRGAVFVGCRFADGVEERLRRGGALIFPRLPDLPFDPYRGTAYDAAALYGRGRYADSPDAAIYAWSRSGQARAVPGALASSLHDWSITDALDEALADCPPQRQVGVMGGHALRRDEPVYAEAARLAAGLSLAGRVVLTGGGPGAMEAAHLGAYLSPWPGALDQALALLSAAPDYAAGLDAWLETARAVLDRWPPSRAGRSVAIPTWFYGHEPTSAFATVIAKYFANALREDTLLHRCRGGIVYLSGEAGTVQEIFQAVTENFYAVDPARLAPMVLVGRDYWERELPAWPLLAALGRRRPFGAAVYCVDSVEEAAAILLRGPSDR